MRLAERIKNMTGEQALLCYQCGLCSGACPVRKHMDISPTQLIRFVQTDNLDKIFKTNTYWICSSCYACQLVCPKEIKITKIIEALRQTKLRMEQDKISISAISKEELERLPPIALVGNFRKTTA